VVESLGCEAAERKGDGLLQHREVADVIGENQHEAGIQGVALGVAQSLMRADRAS
jgi:hypothetical protein